MAMLSKRALLFNQSPACVSLIKAEWNGAADVWKIVIQLIRELSNQLKSSLIELESSPIEWQNSIIHHMHLESSLIEEESYPIELKSSLTELVSSQIE